MSRYDIERFSFAQMTSNGDGKTSASGTMGVFICLVGSLAFLLGAIDRIFFTHSIDIMTQTIVFTGIGGALLGVKKWKAPDDNEYDPRPQQEVVDVVPQEQPEWGGEPSGDDTYYNRDPLE